MANYTSWLRATLRYLVLLVAAFIVLLAAPLPAQTQTITGARQVSSTTNSITMSWDAFSGATSYEIAQTIPRLRDAVDVGNVTTATISDLQPAIQYGFVVRAIANGVRMGTSLTIIGLTQPNVPRNLRTFCIGGTVIDLQWDAPVEGTGSLSRPNILYEAQVGAGNWQARNAGRARRFQNLSVNTTYTLRIRAVAQTGLNESIGAAASIDVTTAATDVGIPSNLQIAEATHNSLKLTWTASSGTVSSYEVSINGGDWADSGSDTEHVFSSLSVLTSYRMRVRAKNGSDVSCAASISASTTDLPPNLVAGTQEAIANATGTKAGQLATGTKQAELATGTKAGELATGTKQAELATGTKQGELATGTKQAELATGTKQGELATGTKVSAAATQAAVNATGTKAGELATGTKQSELATGTKQGELATGTKQGELATGTQLARIATQAAANVSNANKTATQLAVLATGTKLSELATGTKQGELATGTKQAALATGTKQAELATGTKAAVNATGTKQAELDSGSGSTQDNNPPVILAPPDPPPGLRVSDTQEDSVTVNWQASSGADSYEVQGWQDPDQPRSQALSPLYPSWKNIGKDRSYTFSSLSPGEQYSVGVRAVNSIGSSPEVMAAVRTESEDSGEARDGSGAGAADDDGDGDSDEGSGGELPIARTLDDLLPDIVVRNWLLGAQGQRLAEAWRTGAPELSRGFVDAVDLWGYITPGIEVCFRRSGTSIIFIDTAKIPRSQTALSVYIDSQGMVCGIINSPGIVVLMADGTGAPPTASPAPATGGESTKLLNDCIVTTQVWLNFRASPSGTVLYTLAPAVSLTAEEYRDGWYQVDFYGEKGWLSADYVTPEGSC